MKEKAHKDEEKRNVKQEAADKRATEAEVNKTKALQLRNANRAIAKLTPLQLSLSTSLSSKLIKHVAEFATSMAKESHVACQMVLADAKKMVQARSGPVEFKYEGDELSQVVTDAVNSDKLLKGPWDTAMQFACKRVDA